MIGDDFERVIFEVLRVGFACGGFDQFLKQVDVIVAVHVLHNRGNAFQTHAGVDRRFGQRVQLAVAVAVVLHEHQIPDFDVTVTIGVGGTRWAACNIGAMVVKNLGTRAARAGIAHLPEVIRGINADETCRIDFDFIEPDIGGLIVFGINGDPQFVLRDVERVSQEFPGKLDRVAFEIITETEIAKHFKERMVPCRVTDIFQVVVLAAGANATLGTGCTCVVPLILPEKHILELNHARIGKQ